MSAAGLVTTAGKQLKARLLAGDPALVAGGLILGLSWYALGTGTLVEAAGVTGLVQEYARKQINRSAYLQLDDVLGSIRYNNHLYKEVAGPTAIKAYYADFLDTELTGVTFTEEAIFGGLVTVTASPLALANQVTAPGICFWCRAIGGPGFFKATRFEYAPIAIFEEP